MHIDQAIWKKITKRLSLLEDAIENQNDWNQGVYACLRMTSWRNGSTCGTDPMSVLLLGPGSRPRVLPDGIPVGDIPGFYHLAVKMLTVEAAAEYARCQSILSELRQMHEERMALKAKLSPPPKSPPSGGGMNMF
jgi:hypothetical protein